jgi:hypothetical protein
MKINELHVMLVGLALIGIAARVACGLWGVL